MNTYEGMIIFPETLKEEAWDEAVGRVRAEIEKLGGVVESITRLGKRPFARPLKKRHSAGHYAVINFRLDGGQVSALHERLKLGGEIFRAQFLRVNPAATKGSSDGVAQ